MMDGRGDGRSDDGVEVAGWSLYDIPLYIHCVNWLPSGCGEKIMPYHRVFVSWALSEANATFLPTYVGGDVVGGGVVDERP